MNLTQSELTSLHRAGSLPERAELVRLLACQGAELAALYAAADAVRREYCGDKVYLRGLIEFSNVCRLNCHYCGIRKGNKGLNRYRMTPDEIVAVAASAPALGCTTVVLQSGEDTWFTVERMCELLHRIKAAANVAITLSIGERPATEYRAFREAGCDRFLLRFETADRELFARLHPDDDCDRRLACLHAIREAGIQLGSGFMIGLPGATMDTLADDIRFATRLQLDMIGVGPFMAHPDTPLADQPRLADVEVYFKVVAILRLLNPCAHIPSTTAYDALRPLGRDLALQRGANVFMPNITPQKYRALYQLYPGKPCLDEDGAKCAQCVVGRLLRLGRKIGTDAGHSRQPAWRASHPTEP